MEKYVLETQVRVKGKPDTWGVKERTKRMTTEELCRHVGNLCERAGFIKQAMGYKEKEALPTKEEVEEAVTKEKVKKT